MPDIKWSLNLQVVGGPAAAKSDRMNVEAYDKLQFEVAAGESDLEVQVAPEDADLKLLMMSVRGLEDLSKLSFKVNSDTADPVESDSPLLFLLGGGAIGLLNTSSPHTLFFSNTSTGEDASVEILVGRDPTP